MKEIIKSIAELTPQERVELVAKLKIAVATDHDAISAGKDPGNAHWEALTKDPEPEETSKAKTITEKSIKKGSL